MCKLLSMSNDDYRKALDTASKELQKLLRQKDEIEKRIAKLRQTVASLAALSKDDSEEDDKVYIPGALDKAAGYAVATIAAGIVGRTIGFTDAVREVLKASGERMTPPEVKDGLLRMGVNLDAKYSNPLAVIHTTLGRLVDNGEVIIVPKGGKRAFRWKPAQAYPRYNPPKSDKDKEESIPERQLTGSSLTPPSQALLDAALGKKKK